MDQGLMSARYRDLPAPDRAARLDAASDMLAYLQWIRGEPCLSAWEEYFLASMVRQLRDSYGCSPISPAQMQKISEITAKIERCDAMRPDAE